jgi:hypothetical protein
MGWIRHGSLAGALGAGVVVALVACGSSGDEDPFDILPLWVPTDVAVADVDGDGRNDVLAIAGLIARQQQRDGKLTVYRQVAPGSFAAPDTYTFGAYAWRLAVGDIDGDGAADVIVTDAGRTDQTPPRTAVWMLLQDRAQRGRFLPAQQVASGAGYYHAAIVDVTGDGAPDIVVDASPGPSGGASYFPQDAARRGAFLPPQPIALPGSVAGLAAGDLDADLRADLVFWVVTSDRPFTGTMAVARVLPLGGLAPAETALQNTGLSVQNIVPTDVDGDGVRDVVMFFRPSSTEYRARLTSAMQRPPGTFTGIDTSLASVDGIEDAAIADLDGDGRPDAAVAGARPHAGNPSEIRGRVNLFGPSGGGAFTQRQQIDVPFGVHAIAAGDVDGDGRNDLVLLGGENECRVMVQSHAAPGTFEPPRPLR